MSKHGGAREGAGKKKGSLASQTIRAQELRRQLVERFQTEADEIYDVLIVKAKGGEIQAIKELFDRVFGKAKQTVELEGELDMTLKKKARSLLSLVIPKDDDA